MGSRSSGSPTEHDAVTGPTIAACLIARNSSETIERLIASVRPHVDELCVYLGGTSSDDTPAILARLAAGPGAPIRVEQGEWTGSYAEARNASFAMASSEYVSWWDDDEIAEGLEHVRPLLAKHRPDVLYVRRIELWSAEDLSAEPRDRFVRADLGATWSRSIHEELEPSFPAGVRRGIADYATVRVIHHPIHAPNRHKHRQAVEQEIARTGDRDLKNYLARYLAHGDEDDAAAIVVLEEIVGEPMRSVRDQFIAASAFRLLAHCHAKLGRLDMAEAAFQDSKALNQAGLRDPWYALRAKLAGTAPILDDDPLWKKYGADPRTPSDWHDPPGGVVELSPRSSASTPHRQP